MLDYAKYVNYIVTDEGLKVVGIQVSPRVNYALRCYDELTWQEYLRILHEQTSENRAKPSLSDLFPQ